MNRNDGYPQQQAPVIIEPPNGQGARRGPVNYVLKDFK